MKAEHLFIGGPRDGARLDVHSYDDTIVFEVSGVRHTYRRVRITETFGMEHDVFVCDGEPINVVEMLIKNYRKEEK